MEEKKNIDRPSVGQLEKEVAKIRYKNRYGRKLRSTIYVIIVVAAVAALIATMVLPIFQIYGSSMTPTLTEGNIVVSLKNTRFKQGDLIAFYYNNKILVKRVIATSGEWVNIDDDGTVYVNDKKLDEPYVSDKSMGECDQILPYQVPDGKVFVMGDHRNVSIDSRKKSIGCISEELVAGKIEFRVWPLSKFGFVS